MLQGSLTCDVKRTYIQCYWSVKTIFQILNKNIIFLGVWQVQANNDAKIILAEFQKDKTMETFLNRYLASYPDKDFEWFMDRYVLKLI